jgi:hypothetical protein
MVLLAAAVRRQAPPRVVLQGLEGWQELVRALAAHAPAQLGGIVNQAVVVLLGPLGGGGPAAASAARAVEELVAICARNHPAQLRAMPPLPHWVPELQRANQASPPSCTWPPSPPPGRPPACLLRRLC